MKMGDELAVTMEGLHVANAVIEEVDRESGEVTMYIPATRFIVGLAESIVDKNPEAETLLLTDDGLEQKEQRVSRASQTDRNAPRSPVQPIGESAAERELREAYEGSYTPLESMRDLDSSAVDD